MKRILPVVFFLIGLSILPVTAQIPDYFANNPQWKMKYAFGVNGPCITEFEYVLYVQGDTVIGPNTYKKMRTRGTYHYIFVISPGCSSTDYFEDAPNMLVRQDSTRIWRYNSLGDELLYDFDLQVGDTLPVTAFNFNNSIVVDSISSIIVGSGTRQVFHLSDPYVTHLIEGIATINASTNEGGFLVSFPTCMECLQELHCFAVNDTVYYPSFQAPCALNVGIEPNSENLKISFYPNPVEDFMILKLQDNNNSLTQIECTNLMGQQFQIAFDQIASGEWKLNTSHLNKGIYFLTIQNNSRQSTIKILK